MPIDRVIEHNKRDGFGSLCAGGLRVDALAQVPLSFPTYAAILGRAAYRASEQLHLEVGRRVHQAEP